MRTSEHEAPNSFETDESSTCNKNVRRVLLGQVIVRAAGGLERVLKKGPRADLLLRVALLAPLVCESRTGLRRGCKGRGMSVRCGTMDPQGGRAQACLQTAHPFRDECSLERP